MTRFNRCLKWAQLYNVKNKKAYKDRNKSLIVSEMWANRMGCMCLVGYITFTETGKFEKRTALDWL